MLFSLFAIKARTYYSSPEEDLLESFNSDNEMYYVRIAEKVVPTMLNTIRDNYNVNNSKGRWISKSWICLIMYMTAKAILYCSYYSYYYYTT